MPKILLDFTNISKNYEWYTVVTKFNYEAKFVSRLIEQLAKQPAILNYFDDVFVPERKCTVEYKNSQGKMAKRIITDKTMSLYVFVKAKMTEYIYWFIRNTDGCATILATGDSLITIPNNQIITYRDDALIKGNSMKNMQILTKVNPFHNPIHKLKNINTEDVILTVKKFNQKQEDTSKDREIFMKRTKSESLPGVKDINPKILLKYLNKLSLTKKFLDLDNVNFLSNEDLTVLKNAVMQASGKKNNECK